MVDSATWCDHARADIVSVDGGSLTQLCSVADMTISTFVFFRFYCIYLGPYLSEEGGVHITVFIPGRADLVVTDFLLLVERLYTTALHRNGPASYGMGWEGMGGFGWLAAFFRPFFSSPSASI